jgi:NAD(P)-dependent dehydrogenase (short-subunit alcohol dehydrogenase family)
MGSELEGRVAIVTGGARGIGRACARSLAEAGTRVVITDVIDGEGQGLADELTGEGLNAGYQHLDVTDEGAWASVIADTIGRHERLDILINNAGIGSEADAEHETLETWNRVVAINQTGVWLGMRAAIPEMRRGGGGSIINVSSIFGAVGGFGASIAYHATKGAVRLMTKSAALAHATEGIRINSLHPGFVDTPLIASMKGTPAEEAIIAATPMDRLAEAVEVANVVTFLAGQGASYMTGSEVYVDGGWTAR